MAEAALADGFVNVCIDPSLNFYAGKSRIYVEGQYVENESLDVPVVPDVAIAITSTRYIDDMFTAGSVLAESLKVVFGTCGHNTEVFAIPREDADEATKAVYTMTVTGTATSDGLIDIWLGHENFSVEGVIVTTGDTAATVATAIQAAIPARFPYVVTRSNGVLTFTARNAGTVGNFLNPILNWRARQNYFPAGISIATVATTAGATDPVSINYEPVMGECCADVFVLLSGNTTWQRGLRNYIRSRWDCTRPMCFGQGYTYNSGSLGTVLATGDNSAELVRVPVPLNDVTFPWLVVADYAALSACSAVDNPELNIQGPEHGLLRSNKRPTSCANPWTWDEMSQLKEAGFAVYVPAGSGVGGLTYPYISNDVTNYLYDDFNRANDTFRSASSRRLAKKTAIKLAERLRSGQGLALYTRDTRIPEGVFGTNLRMELAKLHKWAQENVGTLFSRFENLEKDITIKEDFEVKPPCQGIPGKLHVFMRYRPPVRFVGFDVTMQPKTIDNCIR